MHQVWLVTLVDEITWEIHRVRVRASSPGKASAEAFRSWPHLSVQSVAKFLKVA